MVASAGVTRPEQLLDFEARHRSESFQITVPHLQLHWDPDRHVAGDALPVKAFCEHRENQVGLLVGAQRSVRHVGHVSTVARLIRRPTRTRSSTVMTSATGILLALYCMLSPLGESLRAWAGVQWPLCASLFVECPVCDPTLPPTDGQVIGTMERAAIATRATATHCGRGPIRRSPQDPVSRRTSAGLRGGAARQSAPHSSAAAGGGGNARRVSTPRSVSARFRYARAWPDSRLTHSWALSSEGAVSTAMLMASRRAPSSSMHWVTSFELRGLSCTHALQPPRARLGTCAAKADSRGLHKYARYQVYSINAIDSPDAPVNGTDGHRFRPRCQHDSRMRAGTHCSMRAGVPILSPLPPLRLRQAGEQILPVCPEQRVPAYGLA